MAILNKYPESPLSTSRDNYEAGRMLKGMADALVKRSRWDEQGDNYFDACKSCLTPIAGTKLTEYTDISQVGALLNLQRDGHRRLGEALAAWSEGRLEERVSDILSVTSALVMVFWQVDFMMAESFIASLSPTLQTLRGSGPRAVPPMRRRKGSWKRPATRPMRPSRKRRPSWRKPSSNARIWPASSR